MKGIINKFLLLSMVMVLGVSCVSREKIVYFQNLEQQQTLLEQVQHSFKIQPNDLLSIVVSAYDLNAVRPFNLISEARPSTDMSGVSINNTQQQGYLTAEDGTIEFPVLGKVKVAGLTRSELSDMLVKRISEYVIDPIVTIRVMNFKVSVLGEVAKPGSYSVEGERLSIPEALGLAGDLTIYGRRDNLLVIRDNGKTKEYKYLDLRNSDFLNSEYYYLKQNDIIYVEPNNAQVQSSSFNRNSSIYISIASLLISVMVLVFR